MVRHDLAMHDFDASAERPISPLAVEHSVCTESGFYIGGLKSQSLKARAMISAKFRFHLISFGLFCRHDYIHDWESKGVLHARVCLGCWLLYSANPMLGF